jgi:hypothetical protein
MQQVRFPVQAIKSSKQGQFEDNEAADIEYPGGDSYTGPIVAGQRSGEGTYTFNNGDIYVGNFDNGLLNGKGIYTNEAGDMYDGNFVAGEILGQGTATFASTPGYSTYEGFWAEGVASGRGKLTFDLGDTYEGQFERGRFHGKGIMTYTNGDAYDGTYVDGNPQGEGQFMFKESNIIQRRRFTNGVDRANTLEIKNSTFDIKKKQNVNIKQFKQPEGQKFFHPKAAKKVSNSSIVANLLNGIGGKSQRKAVKAKEVKAKANAKVKALKARAAPGITKKRVSIAKSSSIKRVLKKTTKMRQEWSDYGYSYPNAQPSTPVDTNKLFNEIDSTPSLRRTKSIQKTIEDARRYFIMLERSRDARNRALVENHTN